MKKLSEATKRIIIFLIGMAIVSSLVRMKKYTTYKLKNFCIDSILGFVMGYSCYLLLSQWIGDGATRAGFTGMIVLWSRPIYDWVEQFISTQLSKIIVKKILDKKSDE